MDISFSYYTEQGSRDNNEDAVSLLESSSTLAIIADGLGGLDDGEVASKQALLTINQQLQGKMPDERLLIDAICRANREICIQQKTGHPMSTTVAVLWLGDYGAIAAHVGDTRIYQFRGDQIKYQSVDHSMAQIAVLVGEMRSDEIRQSEERNRLVRVLGTEDRPKVDCEFLTIQPGDRFLLCSDGFWESVTEEMMLRALEETNTARQWLKKMREKVIEADKPGQDNHSAIALVVNEMR